VLVFAEHGYYRYPRKRVLKVDTRIKNAESFTNDGKLNKIARLEGK
jgi:hypothetical protein